MRVKSAPEKIEQSRYQYTYVKLKSPPIQGKYATVLAPASVTYMGLRMNHHSSMSGINQRNDVLIDCHVIFDCNCMMRFWSFFTFAINFLSPDFDAFIDSALQVAISLFHSLICFLFVKSLLVKEVTSDRKKDKPRMKSVE
jgi:hypothetical protein